MKRYFASSLVLWIAVVASPAGACIAYFGYDDVTMANADAVASSVSTSTALYLVTSESDYIVDDVQYVEARTGPVVLDLTPLIFNPTTFSGVDCTGFERGSANETKTYSYLRGNYQSRLDTFFAVNHQLFRAPQLVIGIAVHLEANNACADNWRVNTAAGYVRQKLADLGPDHYVPRILAGYGLRNLQGTGAVSEGLPVDANGNIKSFPVELDSIGYWAYDIYDPSQGSSHPRNLNAESWSTISQKLDQALRPGQTTFGVLKTFCSQGEPEENAWGVSCSTGTNMNVLEELAINWRDYWLNDTRNEVVIGFLWSGPAGANAYPVLYDEHTSIDNMRNCTMNFLYYK